MKHRLLALLLILMMALCLSGCHYETKEELQPLEFQQMEYITDDYAISYQVPVGFEYDQNQNIFYSSQTGETLTIDSYCDMEKPLKKEDVLVSTMLKLSGETDDMFVYKKESYNAHLHLLGKNKEGTKYALITNRVIEAPGGNVYTGVMVKLSSESSIKQAEAEQLFKYMQILLKERT